MARCPRRPATALYLLVGEASPPPGSFSLRWIAPFEQARPAPGHGLGVLLEPELSSLIGSLAARPDLSDAELDLLIGATLASPNSLARPQWDALLERRVATLPAPYQETARKTLAARQRLGRLVGAGADPLALTISLVTKADTATLSVAGDDDPTKLFANDVGHQLRGLVTSLGRRVVDGDGLKLAARFEAREIGSRVGSYDRVTGTHEETSTRVAMPGAPVGMRNVTETREVTDTETVLYEDAVWEYSLRIELDDGEPPVDVPWVPSWSLKQTQPEVFGGLDKAERGLSRSWLFGVELDLASLPR